MVITENQKRRSGVLIQQRINRKSERRSQNLNCRLTRFDFAPLDLKTIFEVLS